MSSIVLDYHAASKHAPQRYAPGPGRLDWAQQPDPFRVYAGAPKVHLPLAADSLRADYADLFAPAGGVPVASPDLAGVGALLELSLGLSAWKVYGHSRWALRCNPSSGNLHPVEGYLVLPDLAGIPAGVHHYLSRDHLLEHRFQPSEQTLAAWNALFPDHAFLVALTTIHWRTAWKYGVRAWRYCQLDLGHALAGLRCAAAALGWRVELLFPPTDTLSRLLGLAPTNDNDAEPEHADCLVQISLTETPQLDVTNPLARLAALAGEGAWRGEANHLSTGYRREWPQIDAVSVAAAMPADATGATPFVPASLPPRSVARFGIRAADLIRQRRSGQAYDPEGWLDKAALAGILDATLPRPAASPWDLLPWRPRIHLCLMIHRVRDLPAGLYLLPRAPEVVPALRKAMDADFAWHAVAEWPEHMPLFQLLKKNCTESARQISCNQEIASDGALSLGMLAEFTAGLAPGPWGYAHLLQEAGAVGQMLYLEAEAAGMRGTGIGCFFDDVFHQLLGLRDGTFQTLYHFTIGRPIPDPRLRTEPPYSRDCQ
ncbi:MAG: nitroreductase family protein [Magnetococcales bacterium]|nr:nitroreductase family protein [Magnetococcales bacterium]